MTKLLDSFAQIEKETPENNFIAEYVQNKRLIHAFFFELS